MGLAAFQRMRIRQNEKYKPENIKKEQEEVKSVIEEPKVEEVKAEVKQSANKKAKSND